MASVRFTVGVPLDISGVALLLVAFMGSRAKAAVKAKAAGQAEVNSLTMVANKMGMTEQMG